MTGNNSGSESQASTEFVISREFAVSRDVMFQVWSDCRHLRHWFGPKGFPMLHCKNDLRPGGLMLYCLQAPDGTEFWGRWVYREIAPPDRLVFITSFSDAAGGVTRHPWSEEWPLHTLSTVLFTEHAGKTMVTVRWTAYEATPAETQAFADGADSMQQGWSGTFEQLEAYLAQLK